MQKVSIYFIIAERMQNKISLFSNEFKLMITNININDGILTFQCKIINE